MGLRCAVLLLLLAAGGVHADDGGDVAESSGRGAAATGDCETVARELIGAHMEPAPVVDLEPVVFDEGSWTWTELKADACEGTAFGDLCGDFICRSGYEGGSLLCGQDAAWVVEACSAIVCTGPEDSAGYVVSEVQLDVSQTFNVTASCAAGYVGTAIVTACATSSDYGLSGCAKAPEESLQPVRSQAASSGDGDASEGDTAPETCRISDDLTCAGLGVAFAALVLAAIGMVAIKIMEDRRQSHDLKEGRSYFADDSFNYLQASDANLDTEEYGDQNELADKNYKRNGSEYSNVANAELP